VCGLASDYVDHLFARYCIAENGDILAGAVKSKAVSCPMVLKNWSSEPSDARVEPSGSSEAGKNGHPSDCLSFSGIGLRSVPKYGR